MKVLSLGWLGIRTKNSAEMTAFYQNVFGLEVLQKQTTGARFRLADQTEVHVYDAHDEFHEFFGSAPVIGFLVDSFAEAQTAMLQFGIEFLYPEAQRHAGRAWQHFRAPDGHLKEYRLWS